MWGERDYDEQEETYEYYKSTKGEEYANNYAAQPGNSEHQTGLAFDILSPNSNTKNFDETEEFKWLQKNAYKYGFIMRYPKDKEDITGYKYEPWHYRYVGIEVAKQIHEEDITFDEYYAFYIENRWNKWYVQVVETKYQTTAKPVQYAKIFSQNSLKQNHLLKNKKYNY